LSDVTPLLEARNIAKTFVSGTFKKRYNLALDKTSLTIEESPPTITAIAGESGSGKTTLARVLLGLVPPTTGEVIYKGKDIAKMSKNEFRDFRREVQVIFQDPFESYNPFYKVDHVLETAIRKYKLANDKSEEKDLMFDALETVGLRPEDTLGRYPHQLSGGQRQRIMVARAVMLRPKIIVADEPVSMVDASLRATILETLRTLNNEFGISILYITHDLTTAYQVAENIIVLYKGTVAEAGDVEKVINSPTHPYTRLLVDSIPQPDPDLQWGSYSSVSRLTGGMSGNGCVFYDRCTIREDRCDVTPPSLYQPDKYRITRCYAYEESGVFEKDGLTEAFIPASEIAPIKG
jgi:oligopeptide/dipeptide ABC transporter ATP-binding protein